MLEPLVRDGAGRLGTWRPEDLDLPTPLLLHVDTPRSPAPDDARVLLATRAPQGERPWVRDLGSRFTRAPAEAADAARSPILTLPADLPYHPAGGDDLVAAGDAENRGEGAAHVATSPGGPVPDAADVVVLANAANLVQDPSRFVDHAVGVRERAGYPRALYVPGAALPHTLALLVYLGADLVDDAGARLAALRGDFLTPEGPVPRDELDVLPCDCAACRDDASTRAALAGHNVHALRREMARVRTALARGRLRDLVEQRVRTAPELVAHLRRLDADHGAFLRERTAVLRETPLLATSDESLRRPEVRRYVDRLTTRYRPPPSARVLVLLPCSHRKPYSTSRTHKRLRRGLEVPGSDAVHEVVLTSPLGLVPRELEHVYPAAHYDLPVTGRWRGDERQLVREALQALLDRGAYDAVVLHLVAAERELVADLVPNAVVTTVDDDPLSDASLDELAATLRKLAGDGPGVDHDARRLEDLQALARWQLGEAGASLLEGGSVRGRYPWLKVDAPDGEQVAMLVPERGLLSLTWRGGEGLLAAGRNVVEIEDFHPKGSIFAVGVVDADPRIRGEEEVVVVHDGELRGVGRAVMNGREMTEMTRGEAVTVRHHHG